MRVIPKIQILWGMIAAPARTRGVSPENGGRVMGFFPQKIMERPLMEIDAPTVIMTRMRISLDLA